MILSLRFPARKLETVDKYVNQLENHFVKKSHTVFIQRNFIELCFIHDKLRSLFFILYFNQNSSEKIASVFIWLRSRQHLSWNIYSWFVGPTEITFWKYQNILLKTLATQSSNWRFASLFTFGLKEIYFLIAFLILYNYLNKYYIKKIIDGA